MPNRSIGRREFLRTSIAAAAMFGGAGCSRTEPAMGQPFELEEASVDTLRHRLETGQDSAASLVEKYLARIDAIDRSGPSINSLIEINPAAITIAERLDAKRRDGEIRGPLHGIPIVIKDNVDTADRMMTTAGSLAMVGARPMADAPLAAALRAAGAVILAKTNMSEWAHFRSFYAATSGWSGRGGLSRNPYVLDRSTSGSSSGTAGAISANLAAIGIGTETDGSIVSPASCCGLVGIKPTVGLVSRSGIIPISRSQDTAGPMTRTVADATLLLNVMASAPEEGDAVVPGRPVPVPDYTASLVPGGLASARIGVVREALFGYSPAADGIAEAALEVLELEGATLIDPANVATLSQIGEPEMEVMLYEFKEGLNAYLAGLAPDAPVQSLEEIILFNERNEDRELRFFGQETMLRAAEKGPLTSPEYVEARSRCVELSRRLGIDAVMEEHGLDALVAPTGDPAWVIDLVNGDGNNGWSATAAAAAGYPHVTVPAGYAHGLPVGLSFFGRAWSEPTLIRLAYAFEQATAHRQPPQFLTTLEV